MTPPALKIPASMASGTDALPRRPVQASQLPFTFTFTFTNLPYPPICYLLSPTMSCSAQRASSEGGPLSEFRLQNFQNSLILILIRPTYLLPRSGQSPRVSGHS